MYNFLHNAYADFNIVIILVLGVLSFFDGIVDAHYERIETKTWRQKVIYFVLEVILSISPLFFYLILMIDSALVNSISGLATAINFISLMCVMVLISVLARGRARYRWQTMK